MRILALDIATITGWAMGAQSGIWDLSAYTNKPHEICRRVKMGIETYSVELVVFERVMGLQGNAVRVLNQMNGGMMVACGAMKIPFIGYAPTEIKKHATT